MAEPPDDLEEEEKSLDPVKYRLDRAADRLEHDKELGNIGEHLVPMGGTMVREMNQIAEDLGVEEQLDQKMLQTFDQAVHEQTPAEAPGVDIAPIKQVDPQFDEMNFRTIARETFYKVREARTFQRPDESSALLSPQMQSDVSNAIAGDVASHRHHVLPFLTVEDAVIIAAAVADGRERIDVRFHLSGAELERADANDAVVSGTETVNQWDERWRFERDPSVDTSASDEQHILSFKDQWMVAHRGWVVTEIERLQGTPAAPAS